MAKQRQSVQKREREQKKREREKRRNEKAAAKREKRLSRSDGDPADPGAESDDGSQVLPPQEGSMDDPNGGRTI